MTLFRISRFFNSGDILVFSSAFEARLEVREPEDGKEQESRKGKRRRIPVRNLVGKILFWNTAAAAAAVIVFCKGNDLFFTGTVPSYSGKINILSRGSIFHTFMFALSRHRIAVSTPLRIRTRLYSIRDRNHQNQRFLPSRRVWPSIYCTL